VADRVQQVRLAQPGLAVDEQRVVRLAGASATATAAACAKRLDADDERLEGVLRVETRLVVSGSLLFVVGTLLFVGRAVR
jgi:hypothetical protein